MVFNSIPFLIFAFIFFGLWSFMNRENSRRWVFITLMSFVFYGWWDWRFLFLILISGLIDYFAGKYIYQNGKRRKLYLILSLLGNIGSLAVFKYSGFFAQMLEYAFQSIGHPVEITDQVPQFALIVPVGISFYTFQSMSYTIDVYKGKLKPVNNFFHFFAYLSMFPQLVAGPIVRAKDLLGQLAQKRWVSDIQKWNGIKLMVFGLFQKTVLADNIGVMVNQAYGPGNLEQGTLFWWLVLVAFAFQIYCDFSGYSLIARGLAKYMGYHFKMNFNHPYLSTSFKDFWQRWHISLSSWFRDYVYIPLGGSRKGVALGIVFMYVTMIISGFWHGPAIHFIVWGFLHATYLMLERFTGFHKIGNQNMISRFGKSLLVFVLATFAWNYFRAGGMHQANSVMSNLFAFQESGSFFWLYFNSLLFLFIAVVIEFVYWLYSNNLSLKRFYRAYHLDMVFLALCLVAHLFFRGPEAEFIYFQF